MKRNLFSILFFFATFLYAVPKIPTIEDGSATFSFAGNTVLKINPSDGAIISWEIFSIYEDEIVRFNQPSSNARVLNRVNGSDPSLISGTLDANGKVYLINPNGVFVGKTGIVNTASFIASTLDLSNKDFLANNKMHFTGSSVAMVSNAGRIDGWNGDVAIISYYIENEGSINTPKGDSTLIAARDVILSSQGEEKIIIRPVSTEVIGNVGIQNSGTIKALQAELQADGNLYATAINMNGIIDCIGVDKKNGKVELVANKGTCQVSGKVSSLNDDHKGGSIFVSGREVILAKEACLQACGDFGGGEISIGNSLNSFPTAAVYVESGAELNASASGSGNGGVLTIHSMVETHFQGEAIAQGGEIGGDGGKISIGSLQDLHFYGNADTTATFGNKGLLCISSKYLSVEEVEESARKNVLLPKLFHENLKKNNISLIVNEETDLASIKLHAPIRWDYDSSIYLHSANTIYLAESIICDGESEARFTCKAANDIFIKPKNSAMSINILHGDFSINAGKNLFIEGGDSASQAVVFRAKNFNLQACKDLYISGGKGNGSAVILDGSNYHLICGEALHIQKGEGDNAHIELKEGVKCNTY